MFCLITVDISRFVALTLFYKFIQIYRIASLGSRCGGKAAFTWQMRIFNAINDLAQWQTFCSALYTLQMVRECLCIELWYELHSLIYIILSCFICLKVLCFPLIGFPLSLRFVSPSLLIERIPQSSASHSLVPSYGCSG